MRSLATLFVSAPLSSPRRHRGSRPCAGGLAVVGLLLATGGSARASPEVLKHVAGTTTALAGCEPKTYRQPVSNWQKVCDRTQRCTCQAIPPFQSSPTTTTVCANDHYWREYVTCFQDTSCKTYCGTYRSRETRDQIRTCGEHQTYPYVCLPQ